MLYRDALDRVFYCQGWYLCCRQRRMRCEHPVSGGCDMSIIRDLKKIEYRRGILDKGMEPEELPVKVWHGAKIPAQVRKAINDEDLLELGGVYGNKNAGDPVEYDHLKLVLTDDTVEITAFNRGITLLISNAERVRQG
jgi:hypothetical protein